MPRNRDMPCTSCGRLMWRSRTSALIPRCRECREPAHGQYAMYNKRGCRCAECRSACAEYMRDYSARRREAGRPIPYSSYRKRVSSVCEFCSKSFGARTDSARVKFCSLACANDAQGRRLTPKFRIADSVRLALYVRDGWVCQLCFSAVDQGAHYLAPNAPTLDHVQPRARGGSDDPENLRLACRDCNTKRGTDVDWEPARAV